MIPHDDGDDVRRLARARVGWKMHALVYFAVNLAFVGAYALRAGVAPWEAGAPRYWPGYVHLWWGLGLAIHGFGVYGGGGRWVEREEARLRAKLGERP